ncbi:unnamed protein product [Clavelina lepadiformis]|uniref:RRM domain-containing protein n=1 Tax=Clavelina lepadiformis TaxID=159417 RepID=A0ABP0FPG0_CLALP
MDEFVLVGNLADETTMEDLCFLFRFCGIIEHAEVRYDEETFISRGFAFVIFDTPEQAQEALKFNEFPLHGNPIYIRKAKSLGEGPARGKYDGRDA